MAIAGNNGAGARATNGSETGRTRSGPRGAAENAGAQRPQGPLPEGGGQAPAPAGAGGLGGFWRSHVGFVPNPLSKRSQTLAPRIRDALAFDSICPYCAVGCSQKVYVKDGRILDIEGNPESPISAGHLCPKGAATYQFTVNPNRPTNVLYRAPRSDHWEERPLAWAMERVAQLVKTTRDRDLQEQNADGLRVNRLETIGHIGGATLDNEENYLILKLFRNLGIVHITNQARI